MSDLEEFLNNDQIQVPALIKIAIVHYQFETIHPFLDGNGRIGRLLITLFLVNEKILERPLLYLSTYFENRKDLYYDSLSNVRRDNDLLQWIKYFLIGVAQSADLSVKTFTAILKFKDSKEAFIRQNYGKRTTSALQLLNQLLENPYITVDQASKVCGLSYKATNELVKKFCEDNMLCEVTKQTRNRLFMIADYINLFE